MITSNSLYLIQVRLQLEDTSSVCRTNDAENKRFDQQSGRFVLSNTILKFNHLFLNMFIVSGSGVTLSFQRRIRRCSCS